MEHELIMLPLREKYKKYAKVIDVAQSGIPLPLFTRETDSSGEQESVENMVRRITSLLKVACNLTPAQEAQVHLAVQSIQKLGLYAEDGIAVVNEWLYRQEKAVAANAAAKLGCICDNNLFVNGDFWEEDVRIYEFDLNGLEYDDQLMIVRFLVDYLLRLANKGKFIQSGLNLFVDECQNLDFNEGSSMFTILNETRRLNVHAMLAAPTILSKKGMDVMRQCGLCMYFTPFDNERKKVAEYISPLHSEEWLFIVSKLEKGEFIACGYFSVSDKDTARPVRLKTYLPNDENDDQSCSNLNENEEGNVCTA